MFDDPNDVPLTVDFFLTPNFSLLPFTAAVEPLRSANRMAGKTLYHWRVLSEDGKPVQASNGVEVITVGTLYDLTDSDAVLVAAGIGAPH